MAEPETDFVAALRVWRARKDADFAQAGQSPLTPEQIATFEGLAYYEPDAGLCFVVRVEPFDVQERVTMETSAGQPATYVRSGVVRFAVEGIDQQLTVFVEPRQRSSFLPFRDATSGAATYGAGRYVELEPGPEPDTLVLDFNYAYNPFCAYNAQWVCPVPPAENRLSVPIPAGEQVFPGAHAGDG